MIRRLFRRREFRSEINIIPLLDILLVLLLIFVTATPSITQIIEVDLPNSTQSEIVGINSNSTVVIIEVSKKEQCSIVIGKNRIDRLSPEKIVVEVKQKIRSNPKTIFLIGGEKDVPYYKIVSVLNLLRNANVQSVGLMTQPI